MANKQYVTEQGKPIYAMTAQFATPADVYHAAELVRDAGFSKWDVYAPFPIHGIDEAMGVKRTILPLMVGAAAATGVFLGYLMQNWISYDYPMVVQGKPVGSVTAAAGGWESFVPITFEIGVLLSAFMSLFGMLALNGLPRHHHPLMKRDWFLRCSDDQFAVCIEAKDPRFDPQAVRSLFERAKGFNLDVVEDD